MFSSLPSPNNQSKIEQRWPEWNLWNPTQGLRTKAAVMVLEPQVALFKALIWFLNSMPEVDVRCVRRSSEPNRKKKKKKLSVEIQNDQHVLSIRTLPAAHGLSVHFHSTVAMLLNYNTAFPPWNCPGRPGVSVIVVVFYNLTWCIHWVPDHRWWSDLWDPNKWTGSLHPYPG